MNPKLQGYILLGAAVAGLALAALGTLLLLTLPKALIAIGGVLFTYAFFFIMGKDWKD